jgi:hypothetical protein
MTEYLPEGAPKIMRIFKRVGLNPIPDYTKYYFYIFYVITIS